MTDLGTTNLLLGIMAAVMVIEAMAIIGGAIVGFGVYRRVMQIVERLERRQMGPAIARVNDILDDVKGVTGLVSTEAGRLDETIHVTIDRVDARMRRGTARVRAVWHGIRTAVRVFLSGAEPRPSAAATTRHGSIEQGRQPVEETWPRITRRTREAAS